MKHQSFLDILECLSNDFEAPPIISPRVIKCLRTTKPIEDIDFDQIYPPRIRALSEIQWSTINVARNIANMIGKDSKAHFIDVGSGVGKLCILLSLLTDLEIYGIEQRESLFKISQAIVENNNIHNVHFILGNMLSLDWSQYDIFYLYNPFQEHTCGDCHEGLIDKNIDLDKKFFATYINEVFRQMSGLQPEKKVIIFHGYGGRMPPSMKLVESRQVDNGELSLWEKVDEKT